MANPITTVNGTHEFQAAHAQPWNDVSVIPQGDQNDFTWETQISLDDGSSWQGIEVAGATTHTGCKVVSFIPVANARFRVKVTSMGTASTITFATN